MNISAICLALFSLAVLCSGSSILYDVQISEVVNGKEINAEESEIFIEESFLTPQPPTIDLVYEEKDEEIDAFLGRTSFNLSDIQYQTSFGKQEDFIPEEHQTFDIAFAIGAIGGGNSRTWSEWTCCRGVVNIQSRQRMVHAPKLELEFKKCRVANCEASMCKDNKELCQHFLRSMGNSVCLPSNRMSTFMSQHCPLTCKFCDSTQAPPQQPPTRPQFPSFPSFPFQPRPRIPEPRLPKPTPSEIPWWMSSRAPSKEPETATVPWWATKKPTTTKQPSSGNFNLVKVTVFFYRQNFNRQNFGLTSYKFSIDEREQPRYPWKRVPEGGSEVASFYLYRERTRFYSLRLRFCSAKDPQTGVEMWAIERLRCLQGWRENFALYGSQHRSRSSKIYYVGNSGRPRYSSRVSSSTYQNNGYAESPFYFYGPKSDDTAPTVPPTPPTTTTPWWQATSKTPPTTTPWWQATSKTPPTTTPWWQATSKTPPTTTPWWQATSKTPPTTTPWWQATSRTPPTTTPWWQATSRTQPTTTPWWQVSTTTPWWQNTSPITAQRPPSGSRPPYPVTQPNQPFSVSIFNQNCLTAHNFFRAVHNVPPLQWSPELARTSQSWADQLKRIAPERPNTLVLPHLRTNNWPHSDSGAGFRNRGDGENIAWDLSNDGSPIEESVLRWYSEVFYYNRNDPTRAPAADKPVGHLTQMLWKDTTHLGCGVSTTQVQQSRFSLTSTWTVSHYSPGGNVRYGNSPSKTKQLYDEQVPDIESGACMTNTGSCRNGNQCMAFGPSRGTCGCNGGRATCQSAGGCIAWCENKSRAYRAWKEECSGRSRCSCGAEGATCE